MSSLEFFEHHAHRGFYRPVAVVSFEVAVDMVAIAMQHARKLELTELLVNTTGLTGYPPPSTFDRYAMATKWAQNAGGVLRVAMVARSEIIDHQKIGVVMAQNRGTVGDVFTSESEALAWLETRHGPTPPR